MKSLNSVFRPVADFLEGAQSTSAYLMTNGRFTGLQSGRPTSKAHAHGAMAGIITTLTAGVTGAVILCHQAAGLMR
jgi:hypothetical protein